MKRFADTILNAATAVVLIAAMYMLGLPTLKEWRKQRTLRANIEQLWPQLMNSGRLDSGTGTPALVEFGDYQCPVCQLNHRELLALSERHPDVGIVYRHLPLSSHAAAPGAARAAICAEGQGALGGVHNQLFETTNWMSDTNWTRVAREAGVPDLRAFDGCLYSEATTERLAGDLALAKRLGITGTPTFVTRRGVSAGLRPDTALESLLGLPR